MTVSAAADAARRLASLSDDEVAERFRRRPGRPLPRPRRRDPRDEDRPLGARPPASDSRPVQAPAGADPRLCRPSSSRATTSARGTRRPPPRRRRPPPRELGQSSSDRRRAPRRAARQRRRPAAPRRPACTPSSSIIVQNGHATASVTAPVAVASRTRSSLIALPPLLHPHVRAAGAAAERPLPAPRHLERLADPRDDLPRRGANVVVPGEVAGVVVGDRLVARNGLEPPLPDELGEKLRVMHDLVAATEVGVLGTERVEAVRAARDDLRHPASSSVSTFCRACAWKVYSSPIRRAGSPVQPSRGPRIATSRPARDEKLRGRARRLARALVERRCAAHPVEDRRRRVAGLEHPHVEALGPRRPLGLRLAPRVRRPRRRPAASSRPPPGSATRPSRDAGAGRRCGRRARSRPGTRARTRRT